MAARRLALLVAAGRQHQIVAGMIVERGERMATPAVQGEVTLEVHLPKLVRAGPARTAAMAPDARPTPLPSPVATPQDRSDRARRRDVGLAAILERPLDLPPAPDVVASITDLEHFRFDRRRRARRTRLRPPRLLGQARQTLPPIALKPLVAGRRADFEALARIPNVRPLSSPRIPRTPASDPSPTSREMASEPSRSADQEGVHHVPERVSTMSPVYAGRLGGGTFSRPQHNGSLPGGFWFIGSRRGRRWLMRRRRYLLT